MPGLLEPEFEQHFLNWQKEPSPVNADNLLKTVDPVLNAALRTYGTQYSPTLRSRAKIMALDAMKRYDPSRAKLRTHLMTQLQGLRRHAARETQMLSFPEQVSLDLNKLRESENVLRDKLGREPSESEVADHTKLSIRRLQHIRKARPTYAEGSMQYPSDDGEDFYAPAIERSGESSAKQWHEFVYHDLEPRDQVIMEHTLGMFRKPVLSNQAIAQKLNISPGAVSQRKAKLQQKLDLRDELGIF